jgi:transcriptional regulator with XRE-family HTH domain
MNKNLSSTRGEITLKALRKQSGKTQRQVATELNVDQRTVSEWENGAIPGFDKAISLAVCLGITLNQLAASLGFSIDELPDAQPKQNA